MTEKPHEAMTLDTERLLKQSLGDAGIPEDALNTSQHPSQFNNCPMIGHRRSTISNSKHLRNLRQVLFLQGSCEKDVTLPIVQGLHSSP